MSTTTSYRSILFTSALRPNRYAGAQQAGADISLVDLEDSVARESKASARQLAEQFFRERQDGARQLAVRVNGLCEPDGLADLVALTKYASPPDIVMLPKVESPRDIEIAEAILHGTGAKLMAVIETARGLMNASAVASASPRLIALVFGSADFSYSIHAVMSWETLYHARASIVVAARGAGRDAIDTAQFDVGDLDRLAVDARRAREMGFSGKAAIYPKHVAPINNAFSHDTDTVERARRIVAEADASGGNVCVVDGHMVGAPIIDAARRVLNEVGHEGPRG